MNRIVCSRRWIFPQHTTQIDGKRRMWQRNKLKTAIRMRDRCYELHQISGRHQCIVFVSFERERSNCFGCCQITEITINLKNVRMLCVRLCIFVILLVCHRAFLVYVVVIIIVFGKNYLLSHSTLSAFTHFSYTIQKCLNPQRKKITKVIVYCGEHKRQR